MEGPGAAIWEPAPHPRPQGLEGLRQTDILQTDRADKEGVSETARPDRLTGDGKRDKNTKRRTRREEGQGRGEERKGKGKEKQKERERKERRGEQSFGATAPGAFEAAGGVPRARGQARSPASSRAGPQHEWPCTPEEKC